MEIKDVKFKKYIPSEGKALKVKRRCFGCSGIYECVSYSNTHVIVDEDDLLSPVEEVDIQEYDKWIKENGCHLGINSLT